ncbi:Lateral organ boundaries LOB, partial [Arabidopsis suecica]
TLSSSFEAQCRMVDPIYGCVGIISLIQSQTQKKKRKSLSKDQSCPNHLAQFQFLL